MGLLIDQPQGLTTAEYRHLIDAAPQVTILCQRLAARFLQNQQQSHGSRLQPAITGWTTDRKVIEIDQPGSDTEAFLRHCVDLPET